MTNVTEGKVGHTPGPWKIFWAKDALGNENSHQIVGIGEANGDGITDCGFGVWRGDSAEAVANARLIAAAPDLLSALKVIVACEGGDWHPERYARERKECLDAARSAIQRAEGAK